LLLIAFNAAISQDFIEVSNGSSIAEKIKNANLTTTSIRSDFTQLKHLSFLEENVNSSGVFYYAQEQKVRWEYLTPYAYIIIIKGEDITIKNEDKVNQYNAGSNPMMKEINNIMVGIVTGGLLTSDKFKVVYFENDKSYLLKLSPVNKGMKSFINEIHLELNKTDFTVDVLKFLETSEDYTLISFRNKTRNAEIPDNIFNMD